ncbi:hypothetical protein HPB50_013921 [Hyalomma asiaticum]|uniref:Uncharacterized protein n=1 Tax=Hyalomma asiaticum TaxID=266040 RepID=A0ACB7SGS6_HYAAI|nr:hypothetical protein HPB50_013921 [Hyalomma asiaticum]
MEPVEQPQPLQQHKKKKKKAEPAQPRQLWGEQETILLIDLWEDHLTDLRRQKHNASVYDDIAATLRQAGFERTPVQVHNKIENLLQTYRLWLKNQKTGAEPILWVHFWRLHSFLGTLPANDGSRAQESQVINDTTSGGDAAAVCSEESLQEEETVDSPGLCSLSSSSSTSGSPVSSNPASPSPASSNSASSSAMKSQHKKKKSK